MLSCSLAVFTAALFAFRTECPYNEDDQLDKPILALFLCGYLYSMDGCMKIQKGNYIFNVNKINASYLEGGYSIKVRTLCL